jgi:Cu(I)/Ag(I) efflux system membrane fusion protein/cobalt-zinc-cadmium efflux system membrane fusion protein
MKNKVTVALTVLLVMAVSIIGYQTFIMKDGAGNGNEVWDEIYTCSMHPEIIMYEEGNCPVCGMELTHLKKSGEGGRKIIYWAAPTDPDERYFKPGKSIIGMDLVPVFEEPLAIGDTVIIDPAVQQKINLQIVEIQSRDILPVILADAKISVNQRFDFNLTSRINGIVKRLYIDSEGEEIKAGESLCDLYSPEVIEAQQELLDALEYVDSLEEEDDELLLQSGEDLVGQIDSKLRELSISRRDIDRIKESRELITEISINSPTDGIVMQKNIEEGQEISDGEMLLKITDPGRLWVLADVNEYELGLIDIGNSAVTTVDAFPSEEYEGMVNYIHPVIDGATRTAKVRIGIENDYKKLNPSMTAKVEIEAEEIDNAAVIPGNAVIRNGDKNLAVRALGNGKFQPVEIRLGVYSDGYYQVLNGLEKKDLVISPVQMLIESESSLKLAIDQLLPVEPVDSTSGHSGTISDSTTGQKETVHAGAVQ